MAVPRTTARKLCTDTEFSLINESFPPQVGQLAEKDLVRRIQRTRAARDKYRSRSQQQSREASGRVAPRSSRAAQGNDNTVLKQRIFEEALARFEKRGAKFATQLDEPRQPAKPAPTPQRKSAAPTASRSKKARSMPKNMEAGAIAGPPRGRTPGREAIPGPNPKGPQFPRIPQERGRLSAANKRFQARKDSRG